MFNAYVQFLDALEKENQLPPHLRLIRKPDVKKHMPKLKSCFMSKLCCGREAADVKQQLSFELSRYHLSETIIDLAGQVSDLDNQLTEGAEGTAQPSAAAFDWKAELLQLKELKDVLTDEEFETEKAKIMVKTKGAEEQEEGLKIMAEKDAAAGGL